MTKVRMIQSMAGATFSYAPDDVIEVREDVAQAWQDAHVAEIVTEEKPKKAKKGE